MCGGGEDWEGLTHSVVQDSAQLLVFHHPCQLGGAGREEEKGREGGWERERKGERERGPERGREERGREGC